MRPSMRTGLLVVFFAVMFVAAIVLAVRLQASDTPADAERAAPQAPQPSQ